MGIDISHIAKLCRLRIEVSELAEFEKDMESIIAMADALPELEDVKLTPDVSNAMKLREDKAAAGKFTRDELLANAPEVHSGSLAVPKTVE